MSKTKNYKASRDKVDKLKAYTLEEAVKIVKEKNTAEQESKHYNR